MKRHDQNSVYLAAPFFNDTQRALCQQIEDVFAANQRTLVSPRRDVGIVTPENARKVFNANLDAIAACAVVLAVLDYPLDDQQQLRACEPIKRPQSVCPTCLAASWAKPSCPVCVGRGKVFADVRVTPKENWRPVSGAVHVPDTGTAVEIGYAVGRRIPVVAFTQSPPGRMNVMLLCSSVGVLFSLDSLAEYLKPSITEEGLGGVDVVHGYTSAALVKHTAQKVV